MIETNKTPQHENILVNNCEVVLEKIIMLVSLKGEVSVSNERLLNLLMFVAKNGYRGVPKTELKSIITNNKSRRLLLQLLSRLELISEEEGVVYPTTYTMRIVELIKRKKEEIAEVREELRREKRRKSKVTGLKKKRRIIF